MIARISQFGRFFTKLGGCRKKLPNPEFDCAIVYCWEQSILSPAKHVALEVRQGKESYYLSFFPYSTANTNSYSDATTGRSAFFVESLEAEQLFLGYRRRKLDDHKSQDEKSNPEEKLNYFEILHKIRGFGAGKQNAIRNLGAPDQTIKLHSLDLDKMRDRIGALKKELPKTEITQFELETQTLIPSYKSQWASIASAFSCRKQKPDKEDKENKEDKPPIPHNCASIVLDVLYAGGLGDLIPTSSQDVLGAMGFILGAASFIGNTNWIGATINLARTFFMFRGSGGFYVGWCEGQSVHDLIAANKTKEGEKESCSSALGLRFYHASLSALFALVIPGHFFGEWIVTTPQGVMDRVIAAKKEEDALYVPRKQNEMELVSIRIQR